jgi:hypothetical protein
MTDITHAELVARAARWLKNTYGCKVVLTENGAVTGEIPDAIGWKSSGRSVLVECKISRADFKADASKPFRFNPLVGLGAERYYMVPAGSGIVDVVHDLPLDWGLVEVNGRGCKIVVPCRPRKDLRSDMSRSYEMRMLIDALSRVAGRMAPAQLNEWLRYENRDLSASQMQNWVRSEDQKLHLAAQDGWEPVVFPADLPIDEVEDEPWCPKHEMVFEKCACIGPHERHVFYQTIEGHLMAKPMAMHLSKFPPLRSITVADGKIVAAEILS